MKILITAANSDISIGIARIVKSCFKDALLVGVAPDGDYPATYFFDHFEAVPLVSAGDAYKQSLEAVIKKHQINFLIPTSETEINFFNKNQYQPISNILINNAELLANCLDKYQTYLWLNAIGVPVPETHLLSDDFAQDIQHPVVIKPRSSAGSKNMHYVSNREHFAVIKKMYATTSNNFVVQREVGTKDQEYTCALWRFNSDFRYIALKRKLLGGLTGEAEMIDNAIISTVLAKIADKIHGDFFINVQLRMDNNVPFVFEINPRFSSTIVMRHKLGFQDVVWSLLVSFKHSIAQYVSPPIGTKVFRLADELIISN